VISLFGVSMTFFDEQTYVSYFVRSRPFVSYISETKINPADMDALMAELSREKENSALLQAQLKGLWEEFGSYHKEAEAKLDSLKSQLHSDSPSGLDSNQFDHHSDANNGASSSGVAMRFMFASRRSIKEAAAADEELRNANEVEQNSTLKLQLSKLGAENDKLRAENKVA
jgi:hypothetical protein